MHAVIEGQVMRKTRFTNAGFSLIEVMIAVLVLAVGILGAGALQTVGLQTTQGAYLRSQGVILASDIIDRMRANRSVAASYVNAPAAAEPDASCWSAAGGCTPAQIATIDVWRWHNSLAGTLPNGVGIVVKDASNNYVITVTWAENEWVANVGRSSGQLKSVQLSASITP